MTIRNAVDVDRFGNGDPTRALAKLGLSEEDEIVLFASRLDAQKRPVDALLAFASVAAEFPQTHLVFVGSGNQDVALRHESQRLGVASRTHLVGYQTNVEDWLAAATVWILPTERENFSVALLEAMAAGCPVLTTLCPGNDEVVVEGNNAATFPIGDVSIAAQRLGELLRDRESRTRLAKGARASAMHHSSSAMVAAARRLYERIDHSLASR
jgi:glycosyltransferase involved in cell wall biosynthesis